MAPVSMVQCHLPDKSPKRNEITVNPTDPTVEPRAEPADASLGFLRSPAVWACFGFFFIFAAALGGRFAQRFGANCFGRHFAIVGGGPAGRS